MAFESLIGTPQSLRSSELLNGADALIGDPTNSALLANDETAALPQIESLAGTPASDPSDPSTLTSGITDAANAAVLAFHANIEGAADSNGLPGAVHGVTGLGETIGLGKIGQENALTDVLMSPSALLSGDTSNIGHLAPDATAVGSAVDNLAAGTLSDAGANPSLLSPVTDAAPAAQALQPSALETFANAPILAFHSAIESAADADGTSGTIHGLTNLGETVGLGKIGGDNLLTDVASTPMGVVNGDFSSIGNLPADISNVGTAATGLVNGIEADVASGTFLQNPVGDVIANGQSLSALPVASLANGFVDTVHAYAEGATDTLSPGTVHAVTGLGNAVGLGELGGNNSLTDLLATPMALTSGDTTPIANLPSDVAAIGQSAGGIFGGVGSDLSGPSLDAFTHPLTGAGLLAGDLPGQGIVNGVATPVNAAIDGVGSSLGLASATGAASDVTGSMGHTVDDVLHVPVDVIAGASGGLAPIPADGGSNVASIGSVVGSIGGEISSLAGGSSPLNGLDGALPQGVVAGAVAPVTATIGSATEVASSAANLFGGNGAGTGAHDLATVAVGPEGGPNAGTVDLLGASSGPSHVVDVHAASVPASTPTLANISLLSDGSFSFPASGGHGVDALTGALTSAGASAAAPAASPVVQAGPDLGPAHVDLPIAPHADPLAALGHEIHHA